MKSSSLSIKQPTTRAAGTVVVSDEKEKEEEELVTTPTRGKGFFHRRSSEDGFGGENATTKSSFRDRFTSLSRTSEDGNESEYSGFGRERGKHQHHRPIDEREREIRGTERGRTKTNGIFKRAIGETRDASCQKR